ncbi:hypothetical protein H7A76_30645 [Pseudomonas sp. MSSRFD41]|uniref:hypothetical protein n=1 Tax=Pseudomonas sp. MSSRFD41 TaxID=1310370 RepID=UPI00163A468B|nr:hypothetical protein [Pseudomonas sp. MSSRFD41]MBC2659815.1 hypothetical protein [Pseudomonas sp. MSSRFD41]
MLKKGLVMGCVLAALSENSYAGKDPYKVNLAAENLPNLVSIYSAMNSMCRDRPDAELECARRDVAAAEMKNRGWCWGPDNVAGSEKEWIKCQLQAQTNMPSAASVNDIECQRELSCWGDKNFAIASATCRREIEKLAKYSFKWTDGFTDFKFSKYRWSNQKNLIVTYIGDKIQFQNGFGAYEGFTYECDFDTLNKSVKNVIANPGRL